MRIYLLSFLLLSALTLTACGQKESNEIINIDDQESMVVEEEKGTLFDMTEIAKHNSREDCWLLIDGKVYDVTEFIAGGKHGGGDAILEGCGIDSTELYETRPMGSGTPHSDFARGLLNNFYIGNLQ